MTVGSRVYQQKPVRISETKAYRDPHTGYQDKTASIWLKSDRQVNGAGNIIVQTHASDARSENATTDYLVRNDTEHYGYLRPQFQTMLLDKIQRQRNDCYNMSGLRSFVLLSKKFDECSFVLLSSGGEDHQAIQCELNPAPWPRPEASYEQSALKGRWRAAQYVRAVQNHYAPRRFCSLQRPALSRNRNIQTGVGPRSSNAYLKSRKSRIHAPS